MAPHNSPKIKTLWLLPWIAPAEIEELKSLYTCFMALLSLFIVFLGPLYFSQPYRLFLAIFEVLSFALNSVQCIRFLMSAFKLNNSLRRHSPSLKTWHLPSCTATGKVLDNALTNGVSTKIETIPTFRLLHAIILPNYLEPLSILADTLTRLASHEAAKANYAIVLAMEEAEKGHLAKATKIERIFHRYFRHFIITVHPAGIPGESRGKGSNLSWAAQKFYSFARVNKLILEDVLITVADADAAFPEAYFCDVEMKNLENECTGVGRTRIFTAPIFFARNCNEVPILVRAYDDAWSAGIMQNFCTARSIHFPCSVYSLPLCVARDMGWWDVTEAAVGEDVHMFLKCFYESRGRIRSTPIWVPLNLTNVQSNGYLSCLKAKFVQSRRHFSGSKDSLYALRATFAFKINSWSSFVFFLDCCICMLNVCEAHLIAAQLSFMILGPFLASFLDPCSSESSAKYWISVFSRLSLIPYILIGVTRELLYWKIIRSEIFAIKESVVTKDTVPAEAFHATNTLAEFKKQSGQQDLTWVQVYSPLRYLLFILTPVSAILFVAFSAASLAVDALPLLLGFKKTKFNYVVAEKIMPSFLSKKKI